MIKGIIQIIDMKKIQLKREFWILLLVVIAIAVALAFLDVSGHWFQSFYAYLIMLGLGAASIYGVWKAVKASPQVTTVAIVAFSLRLSAGIALALFLPSLGYQTSPEHQSGYIYTDYFSVILKHGI